MSSTLSPLWAFGVYILLAKSDNVGTLTPGIAFATLSLLELQQQPTGTIIDAFEHFQTLYRCFERIQEHMLAEGRHDYRIKLACDPSAKLEGEAGATQPPAQTEQGELSSETKGFVAWTKDVTVGYSNEIVVLKDLNVGIPRGQTTVIVGPIASGKSTLLKLLLGEIRMLQGLIYTSFSTAAYCSQLPWITSGSIRDNILGMNDMQESWYHEVVDASALRPDLKDFVHGDLTQTGTRGTRLSGGQQMRIVRLGIEGENSR